MLTIEEKDKQVIELFKSELKQLGFKKNGRNWTRELDEVTQFLSLIKSQWSWKYDIYLGVHIKSMKWPVKPVFNDCSIAIGCEDIVSKYNNKVLDLEIDEVDMTERLIILDNIINEDIIPFFDLMKSEQDIKEAIKSNIYPDELITYGLIRNTSKYLGISRSKNN